ncbi:MAG: LuxR C-terminal-related transcriptional regulator [Pseudomonadota bacterium]
MIRQIAIYAAVLVGAAFALQWLEYRYFLRTQSLPAVVVLLATGFAALGVWVGTHLVNRGASTRFERNDAAIAALRVTPRELDVLTHLAAGRANKDIAKILHISPNTVKTHVARLLAKLGAARRTEAINKARELRMIP